MSSPTGSPPDRSAPEEERTVRRADLRAGRPEGGRARPRRARSRPNLRLPAVRLPDLTRFGGLTVPAVPEGVTTRARDLRERTRPAWSPVAGFLRLISPLGWAVVALGVAAWVVGRWAGWTEWLMIGAAALVLVLCCVLLAIGRTRVTVTTDLEPVRVSVGEPATGRITVTNDSKRGMLPLLVELPVGVSAARFTLPPLGSGKAHEELFVVPTHRRGVIPVGPARTVQGDPLGLVRRTERWTDVTDLYVHPRTVSLESLGAGLLRDLEGETTQDLSMSDLAFHALREYQPGDDRRYIHWRSSAKAGRLLVRQFLDTRRSHLCLVVDADPEQFQGGEDEAETAISAAASLALRAIRDEQDTTVVCRGQVASRTTASLTLDALARVELGPSDVFGRCTEAFSLAPDTSVVILVTGPQRPFIEAQRALAQFELEVRKVVLTIDAMEETGIQHLGGLTRLNIRRIQDLRAVLASGALV
ncbi:DUF58 domain-containing protein [Phycicoccus sp. Root101]|uniref:DUF58 domain-containing protein n=1 Tax=Phycicoccus sp. Root101 TaxID=1736421 RepID=UPI0007036443|nr:DUF58 domain-containing protein [Phycicoccus sp. Root101]KQU68188.1 hypothetical protein ASC58_11510 [Phycicoccus sp. Root101]